jgi:hypothetical protein
MDDPIHLVVLWARLALAMSTAQFRPHVTRSFTSYFQGQMDFTALLEAILSPDNAYRKQAEAAYGSLCEQPAQVRALSSRDACDLLRSNTLYLANNMTL